MREIEELVAFEGRIAGTDAERRAAVHLEGRLKALGRQAHMESVSVWPNWALTHLLHALIAIVASVVAVGSPLIGFALAAFAALSTLADVTGTAYLLRRLTGRRASQNVSSREDTDRGGTLVIAAHYDAARSGALFGRRFAERRATLAARTRLPLGLGGAFLLAIVAILVCAALRVLGFDSTLVSVVQFVPTVALILSVPLLADSRLSGPVPGAADNASGVAVALRLAERYGNALENMDLWIVFTGAQESMALGMREWLRAHRQELPRGETIVLGIDEVANGSVRYSTREGPLVPVRQDSELVALCDEIAAEDEQAHLGARRQVGRSPSDALAARARRHRAITISSRSGAEQRPNHHQPTDTADRVDPEALERALEFCSELVERIDRQIGPSLR